VCVCVCVLCVCMYVYLCAGDAPPLSGVTDSGPPRPQMPYDGSKQGIWYLVSEPRISSLSTFLFRLPNPIRPAPRRQRPRYSRRGCTNRSSRYGSCCGLRVWLTKPTRRRATLDSGMYTYLSIYPSISISTYTYTYTYINISMSMYAADQGRG